ncbi:hypothetical protein D6C88_10247 [Aureobasidium pullulans]|nr:hypothetical protein D6C88_10247 [Aureobasidium pullulans]
MVSGAIAWNKGKITRKPAREKQWITSNVVFEMLTAMFKDAITKGTPSWSVTIGKDFSLALVSATAARAGDIARSHRYNEDYVLKWKGVVIKVSIDSMRRSSFRSKITMRHTKAYKNDSSQNTVVTLESSDAGCYNARTQIDTLSSTNRRVTQTNNTLKAAAARTGVTVKVTPHDMRRGTAQKAAALNKATGIGSAAQVLGHRPITTMTGLSQKYVGDMHAVDWERRTTLKDGLDWSLQTDGKRQKIARRQRIFTPLSKAGGT